VSPTERIIITASSEDAGSKSADSLPGSATQASRPKQSEENASSFKYHTEHGDESDASAQGQGEPAAADRATPSVEGEDTSLVEEYTQKCQVGRGGVPNVRSRSQQTSVTDRMLTSGRLPRKDRHN
jgi:hypothetical protein